MQPQEDMEAVRPRTTAGADSSRQLEPQPVAACARTLPPAGAKPRALVAMSGGVDSSVAALLMQELGFACTGATMRLLPDDASPDTTDAPDAPDAADAAASSCCSLDSCDDARSVAATLKIPYYVFDLEADFERHVIEPFIAAYAAGVTPNPCVSCNRHLKFERLLSLALTNGFDCLATGHYARIIYDETAGRWRLARAKDAKKDQSYFLYAMTQAQLAKTRMPLGNFTKPQVRAMAEAAGLKTAQKQESQDICFAPAGYAEFIAARRPDLARPGAIVDEDGRLLGEHNGTFRYTIGQRRGLGVASDRPLYVKSVYAAANSVTLADESSLYSSTAVLRDINLIEAASLPSPLKLTAKHRYNGTAREAVAVQTGSDELEVTFTQPQKAVTPGQALVLYNGEFVFGGGTVVSVR